MGKNFLRNSEGYFSFNGRKKLSTYKKKLPSIFFGKNWNSNVEKISTGYDIIPNSSLVILQI